MLPFPVQEQPVVRCVAVNVHGANQVEAIASHTAAVRRISQCTDRAQRAKLAVCVRPADGTTASKDYCHATIVPTYEPPQVRGCRGEYALLPTSTCTARDTAALWDWPAGDQRRRREECCIGAIHDTTIAVRCSSRIVPAEEVHPSTPSPDPVRTSHQKRPLPVTIRSIRVGRH